MEMGFFLKLFNIHIPTKKIARPVFKLINRKIKSIVVYIYVHKNFLYDTLSVYPGYWITRSKPASQKKPLWMLSILPFSSFFSLILSLFFPLLAANKFKLPYLIFFDIQQALCPPRCYHAKKWRNLKVNWKKKIGKPFIWLHFSIAMPCCFLVRVRHFFHTTFRIFEGVVRV